MGTQLSVGMRTLAASLLLQEVVVLMAPNIHVLTRDDVNTVPDPGIPVRPIELPPLTTAVGPQI